MRLGLLGVMVVGCTPAALDDLPAVGDSSSVQVVYTPEGPVLTDARGSFALRVASFGRRDAQELATLGAPAKNGSRMQYAGEGIDAWYVERDDGLQQGFDVRIRPSGTGPLQVRVDVDGRPAWIEGALWWEEEGVPRARYGDLVAWDSQGRTLNTTLDLECEITCAAVLEVDDQDAVYPVTIDPVFTTDDTRVDFPTDFSMVHNSGMTMAMNGEWLLGYDDNSSNQVLVWRRDGTDWVVHQYLEQADWTDAPGRFGRALAVDGDRIAIGATNALFTYRLVGSLWTPDARIDKPDDGLVESGSVSTFGRQVALSGDTLLAAVTNLGLVYAFDRDDTWTLSDTWTGGGDFGRGVSIEGDHALVFEASNPAEVHFYARSAGVWSAAPVSAPLLEARTDLDSGVSSMQGDHAVLGVDGNNDDAYVFELSGGSWTETQEITGTDNTGFAQSVAMGDGWMAISEHNRATGGESRAGVVRLYGLHAGTWTEDQLLTSDTPVRFGQYGTAIADNDEGWLGVYESTRYNNSHPEELHLYVITGDDVDGDGFAALAEGGNDCDDADHAINPDAIEIPDNAVDEDCDGLAPASLTTAGVGDLYLSELHLQPVLENGQHSQGQYVEVTNGSTNDLLLDGLQLTTDTGTLVFATTTAVGPGQAAVIGADLTALENGGVHVDLGYTGSTLPTTGVFSLSDGTDTLDTVDVSAWTLPEGAALVLAPGEDAASNDDAALWCDSLVSFGDNFGSPGEANSCTLNLDIEFHWDLDDGSMVDGATDVQVTLDGTLTTGNEGDGTGAWSTTSAGQTVTWTYAGTGVVYTGTRDLGAVCFPQSTMTGLPAGTTGYWSEEDCGGCATGDVDSDADGFCDAVDLCPHDAPNDTDSDGVCDSDDPCPDDALDDSDLDGSCDSDDRCPGFDDTLDSDADGVPNDCDACEGADDTEDDDGDGIPNACDDCVDVDLGDDDHDGVLNDCDQCPGSDDTLDADDDGVPDGCDECPSDPDDDRDNVCDDVDLCRGFDDHIDTDMDGIPDGCDDDDDCRDDGTGAYLENPYFADLVDGDPTLHVVSGLRPGACWSADGTDGGTVTVADCDGSTDQDWQWSNVWQTFTHSSGFCVDAGSTTVVLSTCAAGLPALGPDETGRVALQDCSACLSAEGLSAGVYTLETAPCVTRQVDRAVRWGIDVQRDFPTAEYTGTDNFNVTDTLYWHASVWGPYARALARAENNNVYVAVGSTKGNGRVALISHAVTVTNARNQARNWVNSAPGSTINLQWSEEDDHDLDTVLAHLHGGGGVIVYGAHPHRHFFYPHPVYTDFDLRMQVLREAGLAGANYGYSAPDDNTTSTGLAIQSDPRLENLTGAVELAARHQLGLETVDPDDLYPLYPGHATASLHQSNLEPIQVYTEALHEAMGSPEISEASPHSWQSSGDFDDLLVHARYFRAQTLWPDQNEAVAGVSDYPGDPGDSETRVSVTLTLDPDEDDPTGSWIPTGYYAPPGERVPVFVESGGSAKHFLMAHWSDDNIMPRSWQFNSSSTSRFPASGGSVVLNRESGELNSPMGGPIYLFAKTGDPDITLTLHNVLPVPSFELGIDDDASFAAELAASTVPFATLGSSEVRFLASKDEVEASPDSHETMITNYDDLLVEMRHFTAEPGFNGAHKFFFDLRVGSGGAHSGNPAYLSQSFETDATAPFWRSDLAVLQARVHGLWGYLHEVGHTYSNTSTPLFIEGGGTWPWREGEPNFVGMAALDAVYGDDSFKGWPNLDDASRQTSRENFICNCEDNGGCDPTDFGTSRPVDLYLNLVDDPAIGWAGVQVIYGAWENPTTSDWAEHWDELAVLMADELGYDFVPYLERYQIPIGAAAEVASDVYPDWPADPLAGLVCP